MEATLYHVVICPVGSKPAEDNVQHVHVVSKDMSSALRYSAGLFPDFNVVSLNQAQPVYLEGTLVDFE